MNINVLLITLLKNGRLKADFFFQGGLAEDWVERHVLQTAPPLRKQLSAASSAHLRILCTSAQKPFATTFLLQVSTTVVILKPRGEAAAVTCSNSVAKGSPALAVAQVPRMTDRT